MQISNSFINHVNKVKFQAEKTDGKKQQVRFAANTSVTLPSAHTVGQSQLNVNMPVSYTKMAEIPIPGLENNASVFKLANGQKVVILPKKGPTYVKTTYNVGSLNETDDIRGISHYIEHNLFNGSKDLAPREYDKRVSDLGGRTNASTSYNYTDYYLSLQLHNEDSLEEAIRLNAMQTQYPTFPIEQLEKEKGPVKSEINMYLDMPYDVSSSTAVNNLFGIKTAATNAVIGTETTINGMTREKVFDYFNTWYTPDNAVTVITGDVDVNQTMALVSKYYNKQNDYSNIHKRYYEELKPTDKPLRKDIIMPNSSSANITLAFAVPEGTSEEDKVNLDTLFSLIESSNSKLTRALDKYGLSASFYSEKLQNKPNSAEAIVCNISLPEEKVEEILEILYQEIGNMAKNPPSQDELAGVKKKRIYSINNIGEKSSDINSVLTRMMLENNPNYLYNTANIIQATTPQKISETAKKFLDLSKVSICVAHSKEATTASINKNYQQMTTRPKTVSFGSTNVNQSFNELTQSVKHFRLRNNVETRFIPSSPASKSSTVMSFSTDELNKFSAPTFDVLNYLLNRGNAFKSNEEISKLKDSKDFALNYSVGSDGMTVIANYYPQDMIEVTGLSLETIMNPNFSQQEFENAKQIIRNELLSSNPSSFENMLNEIFKNKIGKFKSTAEQLKELETLTLQDVQALYAQIINTSQVNSTITAPIMYNPQIQDIYNSQLALGLPNFRPVTKMKSPSYNIYTPQIQPQVIVEENENKQADIVQAYTYKSSENIDDIAKIMVLKTILGGGMASRLFKDLRENQKLAYSVCSDTYSQKDTEIITLEIGTPTDTDDPNEGSPDNVRKALAGFDKHVRDLKTQNVSDEELKNVKLRIKTSLLNSLETVDDKLTVVHSNASTPYDLDYSIELMNAIDRLTAEDIKNAANYVFANPPITSIVASKKTLNALGLRTN